MSEKIDYLIVGAGLFGIVIARLLANVNKECLIIESRNHIGGNCYTERIHGIDVHLYGPHIFHTDKRYVWDFVNKYSEFKPYQLNIKANYKEDIYSLPFNLNTFHEIFGCRTPESAKEMIEKEKTNYEKITNLEEQAISNVGKTVYEKLIKGYTEKQWGKNCKDLPADIINRIPIRLTWNNNYFFDKYQGLPLNGYSAFMENILNGIGDEKKIEYQLNVNFLNDMDYWLGYAKNVIYCGEPDKLMEYRLGELEWRSLKFVHEETNNTLNEDQGCPIMNYTSKDVEFTRKIDQKYLTPDYQEEDKKIVTYEFPRQFERGKTEAYYPINNEKNNELYGRYCSLIEKTYPNIILAGRLGLYKYLDMDDSIDEAFKLFKSINV